MPETGLPVVSRDKNFHPLQAEDPRPRLVGLQGVARLSAVTILLIDTCVRFAISPQRQQRGIIRRRGQPCSSFVAATRTSLSRSAPSA